jgi:hypothetical protein
MLALSNRMDRALTALWEAGTSALVNQNAPDTVGDARDQIRRAFHSVGAAFRTAGVVWSWSFAAQLA